MHERLANLGLALTLALISAGSLMPPQAEGGTGPSPLVTNLLHLPAYALVGLTACWSLAAPLGGQPRRHLLAVLALVTFAGGAIEILQPLVGRDASLGDMVLNALGAMLGWLGWYTWNGAQQAGRA